MSNIFSTVATVEEAVYTMRLSEQTRSTNRTLINDLFNGDPPYTPDDAERNGINFNVNFLEPTNLAHGARGQFLNSLTKTGNYFTVSVDSGDPHKRHEYGQTITREIGKAMKRSLPYYEKVRSDVASLVLHGISPGTWDDRESWCPDPVGVEDVLVPGNTKLTMKNLPFFAIFRSYTANQLQKLVSGPKVDPAWNKKLVDALIENAVRAIFDLGLPSSEIYMPEKIAERIKGDAGTLCSDNVPTIDCWDFYFWNDDDKVQGWNRRIILDADWQGGVSGIAALNSVGGRSARDYIKDDDEFLYNPGKRKYANKLNEIIHWQFADLSAVAPFRYHSVRSLGYLLFAVCHLQNRLRCKFNDALFEHLMQYFRVKSMDEVERALKVNLVNNGFVDETLQFIPAAERWQINANLVAMGMQDNARLIGGNAASYASRTDRGEGGQAPKTATEVMADVQSSTQLVSAALQQIYAYKLFEYLEIARRFSQKNSKDPDVRKFRVNCLKAGVPEEVLDFECWEVTPSQVIGAGNKMMELAITEKLMGARPMFDPEPQRQILREYTLALTDNPALTNSLVPEEPVKVTDSVHDAQMSVGTLMAGGIMLPLKGQNHIQIVETLLSELGMLINQTMQTQSATPDKLAGFSNIANYIGRHIAIIAQDEREGQRVKRYQDALGQFGNMVKAMAQQLAEKMKAQAPQGNGEAQKEQIKLQSMQMQAAIKAENARSSHAERTAQRHTQAELQMQREAEKHALDLEFQRQEHALEMQKKVKETQANEASTTITTAAELRRQGMKAASEPVGEE